MKKLIPVFLTSILCVVAYTTFSQRCSSCPGYSINEASANANVGSVGQGSTSASDWNNLTTTRLGSSDGSRAHTTFSTISIGSTVYTEAISFVFTGFSIPASKKICAVDFKITRMYDFVGASLNATITDAVSIGGVPQSSLAWSTSSSTATYAASGTSFTAAGINASGITVSLQVAASATLSASLPLQFYIDYVQVTVYYSDPCPLPVTLTQFAGQAAADANELSWETESEVNSDYFTVENKSGNDVDWTAIGQVNAAGTTQEANYYTFHHAHFKKDDINYYRLKQVDDDGAVFIYDEIISVDNRKQHKKIVRIINTLGQEIVVDSPGIVIIYYEDGTNDRVMNPVR